MSSPSSIFNFETLREVPRPTPAAWIALTICASVRLWMWGAVEVLETVPSEVLDYGVLARESRQIRHAPVPPAVLLLGSSRTRTCFVAEQMERALRLPPGGVGKVTADAGTPWDALVLLRRNPKLLDSTRLVVLDVEPYQFNDRFDHALPGRFYWAATLAERWRLPGADRGTAVADWLWPYVSQRRDLVRWTAGLRNPLKSHESPPPADLFGPTGDDHFWKLHDDPIRRQAVRAEPRYTPDGFARRSMADFSPSWRMEKALGELVTLLAEHNIPLLLHQPPMHSGVFAWLRKHPAAWTAYDSYANSLESLRSPLVRIAFWELPGEVGISDDDLLDYGHFGRRAAEAYTEVVGRLIADEGLMSARETPRRAWTQGRFHARDVSRLPTDPGIFGRSAPPADLPPRRVRHVLNWSAGTSPKRGPATIQAVNRRPSRGSP